MSIIKEVISYPIEKILKNNNNINLNLNMDTVQDISTKIKFISCIQKDEKINIKQLNVSTNNLMSSLYRLFYQENRTNTLNFLATTINRAFEIVSSYMHSSKSSELLFCKNLLTDLKNCIDGLKNLQYTYQSDRMFYCSIMTLIETVQNKLYELSTMKPDFFIVLQSNDTVERSSSMQIDSETKPITIPVNKVLPLSNEQSPISNSPNDNFVRYNSSVDHITSSSPLYKTPILNSINSIHQQDPSQRVPSLHLGT